MPDRIFVSGWNPDRAVAARAGYLQSGRYATVTAGTDSPSAHSLAQYVIREMEQGQAGTCWVHSGVCLAETLASAQGYDAFPICRRLVGYVGKQLDGGGNPSSGGTCTDAILSMTTEKGAGIAHESLCPYSDNFQTLGTKPPQAAYDDAKKSHIVMPVDITSDDQARKMIASGYPVSIGMWWPYGFANEQTFMTSIGRGTYGHALTIIGYVQPGVWPGDYGKYGWWQIRNWYGMLYPPLAPELAVLLPGYKSDTATKTSDFWCRYDLLTTLQGYNGFEYVSATDLTGLTKKIVETSFSEAFPV